jgi:hypothetical protein
MNVRSLHEKCTAVSKITATCFWLRRTVIYVEQMQFDTSIFFQIFLVLNFL